MRTSTATASTSMASPTATRLDPATLVDEPNHPSARLLTSVCVSNSDSFAHRRTSTCVSPPWVKNVTVSTTSTSGLVAGGAID